MVTGLTFGFYITRANDGFLEYTNGIGGVGSEYANDGVMRIREGVGVEYPLGGGVFTPRVLNCIVHYSSEVTSGLSYQWSPTGGTGGSALVTPNQDITYTLTATVDGCEGSGDAAVSMTVGIEEVLKNNFKVFPNPANNMINLTTIDPVELSSIELMEVSGRVVYSQSPNSLVSQTQIPVSQLANGIYFLRLKMNDGEATFRVAVQK
ncbi:MAG: T9SS type A sorting domain-containing protein [Flavobacteriales bacterium]|nr:T9SS type A sorting domain-containing protein [Flavobacteriales bacterium]